MGIKDYIRNMMRRKEKFKEMEEDYQLQKKLIEKQKSSNERELERFREEYRQRAIKNELEKYRKASKAEFEYGHQILKTKNMFDDGGGTLLKQRNLFCERDSILKNERRLFFS